MSDLQQSSFSSNVDSKVKEVIVDSRINKILSLRTDSSAMLEALDAISEFYSTNSVNARRALRQDIEAKNIELGKKFIAEYAKVCVRIESVELAFKKFEESSEKLAKKVNESDQNMKAFMEKASYLENNRNLLLDQSNEISTFLRKYQLSTDEINILYNASSSSSFLSNTSSAAEFFDTLQRLCISYNECKNMVEKHSHTAAFELLEILGQHQDAAYQRLFTWVKSKCDTLTEAGSASTSDDIDSILQVAIRYLKNLPIYFNQCQDLVINSRRSQLVQKFVLALTQGGPGGGHHLYRAIDLHANDAARYIGDMLAWMHQALASEEELTAIF